MVKEILTSGNIEIEKKKKKNYRHKTLIFLGYLDIEKVLVSRRMFFGGKTYIYFIGYFYDNRKVKSLHIILTKTSSYLKNL